MLDESLRTAIAAAAGMSHADDMHVVQCSSRGATGAIILFAWAGREQDPRLVVKTPRDPGLNHSVGREWETVVRLQQDPTLARLLPSARARFTLNDNVYYAYEGFGGRTMFSIFRNRLLMPQRRMLQRFATHALHAAVALHMTRTGAVSARQVSDDLVQDLAWLESAVGALPSGIRTRATAAAATIAAVESTLPFGRVHGDFSPYNLMLRPGDGHPAIGIIDWEHTEEERPQHLDIFRFMGAAIMMGQRGPVRKTVFPSMADAANPMVDDLFRPWLVRMGTDSAAAAWMTPPVLHALWWHYWIHAARREQERSANPTEFSESNYLRGLSALAGAEA